MTGEIILISFVIRILMREPQVKREKLTRAITFRVTEEKYLEIERLAAEAEETPTDWCREAALERVVRGHGLTPNERIIFEELSRVRYLVGHAFRLLADGKLTAA